MNCEKCGSKDVKVLDVVHNNDAYEIYRKKQCKNCGRMFYTMEFEVEDDAVFMESWYEHYRKKPKKSEEEKGYKRDVEVPKVFRPAKVGDKVRILEYPNSYSFVDKNEVVTVGKDYGNGAIGVHYSEFKHFPEYRESVLKALETGDVPMEDRDDWIIPKDEHWYFTQLDYIIVDEQK